MSKRELKGLKAFADAAVSNASSLATAVVLSRTRKRKAAASEETISVAIAATQQAGANGSGSISDLAADVLRTIDMVKKARTSSPESVAEVKLSDSSSSGSEPPAMPAPKPEPDCPEVSPTASVAAEMADGDNAGAGGGGGAGKPPAPPEPKKPRGKGKARAKAARGQQQDGGEAKEEEDQQQQQQQQPRNNSNLREAQARVARDRAAHFARVDKTPEATAPAVVRRISSAGGSAAAAAEPEEWCGPFATARRLLNARADAAAARQRKLNGEDVSEEDSDAENGDGSAKKPAKPAHKGANYARRCATDGVRSGTVPQAAWWWSGEGRGRGSLIGRACRVAPLFNLCLSVVVQWEGRGRGSLIGRVFRVAPLFDLCLRLVADNFDCVEELGDVTPEVRNRLGALLCRQLQLTPEVLSRLAAPGVAEVVLPDCSRIDAQQMQVVLPDCSRIDAQQAQPLPRSAAVVPRHAVRFDHTMASLGVTTLLRCRETLAALELRMCGRCFTGATVAALASAGGLPSVTRLALTGTYLLPDTALDALLAAAPRLRHLTLAQSARLGARGAAAIADRCGATLQSLSLASCEGVDAAALAHIARCGALTALDLSGVAAVTDEALARVLSACGEKLEALRVAHCDALTDGAVQAILSLADVPLVTGAALAVLFGDAAAAHDLGDAFCGPPLVELSLADVPLITGAALAVLFGDAAAARDLGDASHALASLRAVALRGAARGGVDDAVVVPLARACAGTLREADFGGSGVGDAGLVALAERCGASLVRLDLSFCRGVSDAGVGRLVDAAPRLRALALWGDLQIGDAFLKRHSNEELHVIKARYSNEELHVMKT
ncbi:hypothetical protein JKP88DRAFT_354036 [Tribonema minus]|uniref:Uncharacterized protein n=1 Tax=Tribonema minus TaxID=303371 RepID=A0A836CJL7_9STRA|nr:hypothetical protein JKP88DRAFT_354036 [Tribonema minus]